MFKNFYLGLHVINNLQHRSCKPLDERVREASIANSRPCRMSHPRIKYTLSCMNGNCTNRLGEYLVLIVTTVSPKTSWQTMMSVLKGHVHTLFAKLCLFLLIEMTLRFLLDLVECKVTLYLTLNIPCLSAGTSQRYCTWRKIKGDLKDLDLFQNKVNVKVTACIYAL